MSKDNQADALSGAVRGKIDDIKNVDGRLTTLNQNINSSEGPIKQHLQSEEYITSTLEGLAGKTINESLANEDIQNLVNNLHDNLDQNIKLLPKEAADKLKFDFARAEAALKGFALPLNKGGPFDELLFMGISSEKEIFDNPISATKKALIAVSGQKNIPKEKYAEAVKNKAMEILKEDPKITKEQLEQYEKFITQGDKNQKYDATQKVFVPKVNIISQIESQALQEAANDAVQKISDRLKTNKKVGEKLNNIINSLGIEDKQIADSLLVVVTKLPSEELQEKGSKIVKDFAPLLQSDNPAIANGAKKALTELDPKYLADAGETIAENIQKASKTTLLQKVKGLFKEKGYYAQQNVDNVVSSLKVDSAEFTKYTQSSQNKAKEQPKNPEPAQSQSKEHTSKIRSNIETSGESKTQESKITLSNSKRSHVKNLSDRNTKKNVGRSGGLHP